MRTQSPALALGLTMVLLVAAGPALAQYKVVGPDGKVTYTDRPTAAEAGGQVQALRRGDSGTAVAAAVAALPAELRPIVARFPVVLYTSADCPPCDTGRKLLQQRGVPYTERLASGDDDIAALQRLTGGRTVPALTVGGQALRGFLEADWSATLDLAGYPKESRLPRGWQPPAPSPLVARASAPPAPAAAATPPGALPGDARPADPQAPAGPGNIRF